MVLPCACGLFLFVLRNTNKHFWHHCRGTVAIFPSNLVRPHICIISFYEKTKIFSYIFSIMKPIPNPTLSASKGEFPKPPSKSNLSSSYELYPGLIAMVRAQPFSGYYNENPCHHLHEFSHGEGEAMVHTCRRKYQWGLG